MSLSILFHFLCTQHVSDNNIYIIKSSVRCVGDLVRLGLSSVRVAGWQANLQHTTNQEHYDRCGNSTE